MADKAEYSEKSEAYGWGGGGGFRTGNRWDY